MELDAVDGKRLVLQAHDFAFGRFGGDSEDVGQGVAFDDERMVARGLEGRGKVSEDTFAGVEDR